MAPLAKKVPDPWNRRYGPLLSKAFSKWPQSQINCPPLAYDIIFITLR